MTRIFGKGVLFGIAVVTMLFVGDAWAGRRCMCAEMPGQTWQSRVTDKLNAATAVFSGKVIAVEWRTDISPPQRMAVPEGGDPADWETKVVRFKVDRWWRLAVEQEIVLYTAQRRNTNLTLGTGNSCDYHFELGESYVVFADGPETRLTTHSCAGNRPLKLAGEVLNVLGRGEKPKRPSTDKN